MCITAALGSTSCRQHLLHLETVHPLCSTEVIRGRLAANKCMDGYVKTVCHRLHLTHFLLKYQAALPQRRCRCITLILAV